MGEIKKGDKVKCIDDCFLESDTIKFLNLSLPQKGERYIVRETIRTEGQEALLLEEVRNGINGRYEPAFLKYRFEPYSE